MPDLELDVLKGSLQGPLGSQAIDYGAVARIRRLDARETERSVAVRVGGATCIPGLAAGKYEVSVFLPSGTIISRDVRVGDDGQAALVLDASGAPQPAFSWHHFAGTVPGKVGRLHPSKASSTGRSAVKAAVMTDSDADDAEENYFALVAGRQGLPAILTIEAGPALQESPIDAAKTAEVWRMLADGLRAAEKPAKMVRGFVTRREAAKGGEGARQVWEFGLDPGLFDGKRPPRRYALVQFEGSNEIASLPLPWRLVGDEGWDGGEFVDLLVDRTGHHDVRTRVMVRDEQFSGLVGFIGNGALGLARELIGSPNGAAQSALEILFHKARNPLGACAAAYVLLATTPFAEAEQQQWFGWIENLGNNAAYSWVPDGALIQARMKLLAAENAEEAATAIPYLHRALRNGPPFYSMGMGWLVETLAHFRKTDPLIDEIFPDVDRVARHVDTSQAFLVLKFPVSQ